MCNNMRWELRSYVACRDINVIYYLKCNMCDNKKTYIGKMVGDNVVGFKNRFNQHSSDSKTSNSTRKFPIHVYPCAIKSKCLNVPYFQLNIMMKLKDSRQLKFYENYFHKKGMILLTVQSIQKTLIRNTLRWVYLVNASYLLFFFAVE